MIDIKNAKEIEIMTKGGKILAETVFALVKHAKPGVSELELEQLAEKLITEQGGQPGFKRVPGYHHTLCVSTNDVVVHGIPTSYRLQENDVIGIDCGVFLDGFNTDMSETIRVRSKKSDDDEIDNFLVIGKKALIQAIEVIKPGNRIGHISKVIQEIVEGSGYSIVRSLIGHGVGRNLHEEPEIPGFLNKPIEKTPMLKEGMTLAIEVIYNMGKPDVVYTQTDDWTIKTKDGSISGVFERTVLVTKTGYKLLTD